MNVRNLAVPAPGVTDAPEGWGMFVVFRSLFLACIGLALSSWISGIGAWGDAGYVTASVLAWGGFIAAVVWAVIGNGSGDFRRDLRLIFRPIDIVIALLFGGALRCAAVFAEMLASGLTEPLLPSLMLLDGGLSLTVWLMLIIAPVVVAPLVEETFFRGVVQPSLAQAAQRVSVLTRGVARTIAVVVTAALFAGAHLLVNPTQQTPTAIAIIFCVGVVCGVLTVWTGRLAPAICTHLVFNASGVTLLLLGTFS